MIFVDSNLFIYAVGRAHPLREAAQAFFLEAREQGAMLVTSAEVLQELLHVYLPVGRLETLDAAMRLATEGVDGIFPVSQETIMHARMLIESHPSLTARDLIHLSFCRLNGIAKLKIFDRALQSAFN